jgi:hypothetical protein
VVICDTDIKYGSNIKHLAKQFGFQAAKSYDESFRKVRQFMNLEWGTINDELYFPHARLITGFVTRLTRQVPLVEQELPTLPEHMSSPRKLVGFVLLDL